MFEQCFDARVIDGQLIPAGPLQAFEGQQVRVTVSGPTNSTPAAVGELPEVSVPDDFDVEKDIYARMPFQSSEVRNSTLVEAGVLKPCLILPEDLPDE